MSRRLIILGCVAEKGREAAPARDLYTSQLWRARRGYAEDSGLPWRIFSAKHGLILPETVIEPYDMIFPGPWGHREQLSAHAVGIIFGQGFRPVEIHAGAAYCAELVPMLQRFGIEVLLPLEHLGIGQQLAWYAERRTAAERVNA